MNKYSVYASCLDARTGEGQLADMILKEMRKQNNLDVVISCGPREYRSNIFQKYVLPQLILLRAMMNKLRKSHEKTLFINYCPIWNPFIALAVRSGITVGPLTGSLLDFSEVPIDGVGFIRRRILPMLTRITLTLLPKEQVYWAATNSVYKSLVSKGLNAYLVPIGVLSVRGRCHTGCVNKEYDFFFYSKNHSMKDHTNVVNFAVKLSKLGYKCILVGEKVQYQKGLKSFDKVSAEAFRQLLQDSKCFMHLSFEDGGIAPYQALAIGLPIITHEYSSLHALFPKLVKCVNYSDLHNDSLTSLVKVLDQTIEGGACSNELIEKSLKLYREQFNEWLIEVCK